MDNSPPGPSREIPTITLDSDEDSSSSVILISSESCASGSEPDSDSSVQSLNYGLGSSRARYTRGLTEPRLKKSTLDNFSSALISVQNKETSWPLFSSNVADVFCAFSQMSSYGQRLYVNLLSSKHIWQRKKAFHPENNNELVNDILAMESGGLVTTDYSTESVELLLRLLTSAEIRAMCRHFKTRCSGSRKEMIKGILQIDASRIMEVRRRINHHVGDLLKLTEAPRDCMLNILILHSLPHGLLLSKDGRSPILSIMDMVTERSVVYLDYTISPAPTIFHSRDHFLRAVEAMRLNGKVRYCIYKKRRSEFCANFHLALQNFQCVLKDERTRSLDSDLPKCLRQFTAGSILAEALLNSMEGLRMIEKYDLMIVGYQSLLSQNIYKSNERGLWYDQLASAHISSLDIPSAIEMLIDALLEKTLDPVYRMLLSGRAVKVTQYQYTSMMMLEQIQMLNSMLLCVKSPPTVFVHVRCTLVKRQGLHRMFYHLVSDLGAGPTFSSLEQVVLYRYRKLGYDDGLIGGDHLSMSIFCVFFWDIIYAVNVRNAFLSQYQKEPIDLSTGDFYSNREAAIKKRLTDMNEKWTYREIYAFVDSAWKYKGRECLVSWTKFGDKQKFKQIMECIGLKVISAICLRLSKEYPVARYGFPGILVWNTNTKVVKYFTMKDGNVPPSPFEIGWLHKLDDAGADAALAQIEVTPLHGFTQDSSSDDAGPPPPKQPRFGEGSTSK